MPSTRIKQNLTILAFFAAFALSGAFWMAIQTGQRFGPLPPLYQVSFNVRDADGIAEAADVRIAGIPVGKVLAIKTRNSGAQVLMGIERQYTPIYTDAVVLIRPKSLLGEKYVDMNRGSSNVEIPDGGSLPEAQAMTQVEVDQVLQNSDAATRKALSTNIITLGQGTKDRGQDVNPTILELRHIAEHLTPVSARFKDRTAQIDHILVDTDLILQTLADEHQQLATLLESADAVTGTIAQNDTHLAGILNSGSSTIARLNVAVSQQNNDSNIRTAIEQAPGVLGHLDTFLGLTNHDINTLVPSLLLGQQFNYSADQLTVSKSSAFQIVREWDSGNREYDSLAQSVPAGRLHGFTTLSHTCNDNSHAGDTQYNPSATYPYPCPAFYDNGGGFGPMSGATAPSSAASSTAAAPVISGRDEIESSLLEYLLGR